MRTEPTSNLAAIAAAAGVSRMTVSRALRNARGVDPATHRRVLAVVKKMGWRPNPFVSAFMSYVRTKRIHGDTGVIAYLTSDYTPRGWDSLGAYTRFHQGARERAENRGYRLEVFRLREQGMTARRLGQVLYARGIRGVVVSPLLSAHAHLNLDWEKFSAAAIGYSLLKPSLSRATNDQCDTMLLALRELRKLGYERIGLMMPHHDDARVYYHWSSAFLSHHWRYQPSTRPLLYLPARWRDDAAIAWIRQARPQVVVSTSSDFLGTLLQSGFDIPRELGVVMLDWSKSHAPAAGVDQRAEEVGGAAVDIVVDQINKNEAGVPACPKTVTMTGQWIPGGTVQNLKAGKSHARASGQPAPRRKRKAAQPALR
jgi:DNA-binding LacI/PurR family transcriptional regulator